MDAVLRVIDREGIAAVTTRAIAAEARVNLATLHYRFGGKDALLVAALDEVTDRIIAAFAESQPSDVGAASAVSATVAALAALTQAQPRLPLVRCELLLYFQRHSAHAPEARAQQQRYLAALAEAYRPGRAGSGEWLSAEALADLVALTVDGLALSVVLDPTDQARRARAAVVADALTRMDPR
jgi:AcrR family transcriptional regulator